MLKSQSVQILVFVRALASSYYPQHYPIEVRLAIALLFVCGFTFLVEVEAVGSMFWICFGLYVVSVWMDTCFNTLLPSLLGEGQSN
jgi:hypothetical protein